MKGDLHNDIKNEKFKNKKVVIYFTQISEENHNDEFEFMNGFLENDELYFSHNYYGSGTRLGEYYEIFNPEFGYKKIKFRITIDNIELFNKVVDFSDIALDLIDINKDFYTNTNDYDKKCEDIKNGKLCLLNSFSKVSISDDNISITFGFRDLHRFNDIVELCSIRIKLN